MTLSIPSTGLSKALSGVLKMFLSQDFGLNCVAVKTTGDKLLLKGTSFFACLFSKNLVQKKTHTKCIK